MTVTKDPEGFERKNLHQLVNFQDKVVLEIGCGEGRLTWKYAEAPKQVIAFDLDHDSLRIARVDRPYNMQNHVHFAGASAKHIPFSKEKFDIAILAWSL